MKIKRKFLVLLLIVSVTLMTNLTAFAAPGNNNNEVSIPCNEILPENSDDSSEYFIFKMVDYLKKALIYGHTSRISSRIYYQFTTFKGKSLDMPPGILQASISVQY